MGTYSFFSHRRFFNTVSEKITHKQHLQNQKKQMSQALPPVHKEWQRENSEQLEIYIIGEQLSMSEKEIETQWGSITERNRSKINYNKMPEGVHRDNKNAINYSNGNSNINKVRIPSKKRKNAWKNFRKLFPEVANRVEKKK